MLQCPRLNAKSRCGSANSGGRLVTAKTIPLRWVPDFGSVSVRFFRSR